MGNFFAKLLSPEFDGGFLFLASKGAPRNRLFTAASRRQSRCVEQYRTFSEESPRFLARRCGINLKTVANWKKRESVKDLLMGPRAPHATILSLEEGSGHRGLSPAHAAAAL